MLNIKALAVATAVSAGVVFAMPVASQAMPSASPVKIQAVNDGNIVNVHYKKKWNRRWARYCRYNWNDDWRCRRYRHARIYRYRYYDPYYEPYYYGRPRAYGPGIGLHFRID